VTEALRQRDAASVDPNERDRVEIRNTLDDLVCDAGDGATECVCIQQDFLGPVVTPFGGGWWGMRFGRSHQRLLSGLTGPS
jgi:hypothetical protein